MIVFPNAKINIGLNIVGKRADGYHDLETIFYPIGIKDALEVVEANELSFQSTGLDIPGAPDRNICLKAYRMLSLDFKIPPLKIHLHKNIPIGAGIGGGSADASFLIKLLNEKFNLGLNRERMEAYASALGADCAFFIKNQPVFASGRGDRFEEIELDLSKYFIALVMPDLHISTFEAFGGVRPRKPGVSLKELVKENPVLWKDSVINDFEQGIISQHPEIGYLKHLLYESGAIYASMSGSGSSVYGIFKAPLKLPELEIGNRVFYGV
ncbi:MAG: 4-(cytidine 5'-diphospho)-2-C-methyl-D-erythritol kinase [Daejeonella sp.]